jgi:conjugative transfer signal peptidase TraF
MAGPPPRARLVLFNDSASMPEGLWLRTGLDPAKGRAVAFTVPVLGRAYAARRTRRPAAFTILKAVAAVPGDIVCNQGGSFRVNGRFLGVAQVKDGSGIVLPQWWGCRPLRAGEYFVFSARIPNSFDSRYFGPVSRDQILAVYRPLWTFA